MAYDAITLSKLTKEFNDTIKGGKINKIFMPQKDDVVINIFNKQSLKLLMSCNSNVNRIHLTEYSQENPLTAPSFCMLLRKYLLGGTITAIEQQPFERVVDFTVATKNELGYKNDVHLIFELTGRDSNVILTDADYKIIDGLRHFSCDLTTQRIVLPNAKYRFFDKQDKIPPTDKQAIMTAAKNCDDIHDFVSKKILGVCPSTVNEICALANNDVNNVCSAFDTYFDNLYNTMPVIVYNNDLPKDVFPYDYVSSKGKKISFATLNEAHDRFYYNKSKTQRFAEKAKGVSTVLKNAINRTEKKLGIQKQAYVEAQQNTQNKIFGDLILANLGNIQKNSDGFDAVNYYEENCPVVHIPLDRALSAKQNAQEYYKKYAKQKSTLKHNSVLIQQNTAMLDYLKSVKKNLEFCSTSEDLQEIAQELTEAGIIKNKAKNGKKQQAKTAITPLRFDLNGYALFVGKNNIQNDYVTFKLARSSDLWLHAQNIHSSHAVIQSDGEKVPDNVILIAAEIVAAYSQASAGTKIAVDYCLKKRVKKPPESPKGFVVYTDFNTVIVNPDKHEELLSQKQ